MKDQIVHVPAVLSEMLDIPRSEARRLIDQGKVRADGRTLNPGEHDLDDSKSRVFEVDRIQVPTKC